MGYSVSALLASSPTHTNTHTHTLLRAVLFSNASREAVRKENPSMPVKDVAR